MCKAKRSFTLISPLVTEQKKPKLFKLSDQVTEDEILDTKNYGSLEHKCRQCYIRKDENRFCDVFHIKRLVDPQIPSIPILDGEIRQTYTYKNPECITNNIG